MFRDILQGSFVRTMTRRRITMIIIRGGGVGGYFDDINNFNKIVNDNIFMLPGVHTFE